MNRDTARSQQVDLDRIDLAHGNAVAELCEASRRYQADVTGTKDRDATFRHGEQASAAKFRGAADMAACAS
ncbi:hypothetical protein GCM10027569_00920 [Flindersiella endophytica]